MTMKEPQSLDQLEEAAWNWLDSKFLNVEAGDDPNDRTYSADEMVDAFMAGGEASTGVEHLQSVVELVHELRYVESVYRQNCVEPGEPSSLLEGVQKLLAKYEHVK